MAVASKKGRIRKCVVRQDGYDDLEEEGVRAVDDKEGKCQIENGTLVSIELENWMNIRGPTKYCFNNGINVITGLNGSGKSSVACGIAISLGYDTHILARGHYLSSYIRNGSTSCRLVVTIRNKSELGNGFVSEIERVITIVEPNKTSRTSSQPEIRSSWRLNGKKCLERDVLALRSELNIQLDNMVAFLAQQKVSQFASQSPREIFIDTLRIISNGNLKPKHSQNESVGAEIALSGSDFEENDLLGVYYKFLDIFKDSKESKLRLKDNETRLSHLNKEISKSKENEIKYIQYLLHKMGINLTHFFQSLNDIAKDKSSLESLDEVKKGVLLDLTGAKRELRRKEEEFSKVDAELKLAKKKSEDFLKKIQLEKLGKRYKSIACNLEETVSRLQENYKDPSILLERYRAKIRGLEGKISDTEIKIRYYKDQLEKEWVPKLVRCKLYEEDQPQMFDILTAEKKKKLLGEGVSEMSSKTIAIQRSIKEFEFALSKLVEKKGSIQPCHSESAKEKIMREKYLNRVNPKVLSNAKRENILGYFEKIHEYSSRFDTFLPRKKVIGPIGSYISLKNIKFQALVEAFLQQFHYYFVSEREDVKLLTERYRLNVLTLSNSKTPICPKLDDELREIGVTGFLHEHLEFEDENMKNILYQISAQFFTCVIIDNPELADRVQEDEVLYKLSDWLKRKYDQPGNKVSNNVHLFIVTQSAKDDVPSRNGVLFKLVTSMYNSNSKTISMINLGERMNTILFSDDLVKEEVSSSTSEIDKKKSQLDAEIDQLELKIRESSKDLEEMKEQYHGEIRLMNMISECINNVPSLFDKVSALEKQLEVLRNDLKQSTPDESEVKLRNQRAIQSAFTGEDPGGSLELGGTFKSSIIDELTRLKELLVEISTVDFTKDKELRGRVSELNTSCSSIQKEMSKKKDEIRHLEMRISQVNEDYDRIVSALDTKRKVSIDSYLQYYSTYCQYHKRLRFSRGSGEKIYEFVYSKANKTDGSLSQDHNDASIKDVPGVELFSSIISGSRCRSSSSSRMAGSELIPSYCLEMISQVSSEFGLLKCEGTQLEEILNNTLGKNSSSFKTSGARVGPSEEEEKTGEDGSKDGAGSGRKRVKKTPTLFGVLLDDDEYKSKYEDLFNSITSLEAKTHNTNLERMADLEQEFEILSQESQELTRKVEMYEDLVGKHYRKWLERLEMIENVASHCFGVFMRFISDRHNGKILIPFINNFMLFLNTTAAEVDNKAIFNYFVDNFENDSKLNIMVRFSPDEDLRLFSSSSISGGEQSLCTILFILSLQGLCAENSLKLFDEINQGLDNDREIKLMELLDILTNKEKTEQLLNNEEEERPARLANYKNCQIIIITPHIFPGVVFENFSVHFVLNGPGFIVNWT